MPSISETIEESKAPGIIKLALCVPMRGKIDAIFLQSYLSLFIHLLKKRGIVAQPIFSDVMPLDKARCALVKSAILNKADYALWMDSDIIMTEKHFERLWKTLHEPDNDGNERHIVTGVYYEREIPYDAVIRNKNVLGLYEKIMQFPEDKPFKVDGMGFGFVLMKMKPMRSAFSATGGYPFKWTKKVSEDLYLCDLMQNRVKGIPHLKDDKGDREVSYNIWCEPRVQVPHHGAYVTQWHYLHYKLDEYSDIQELSRYLKIKSEECFQRCIHGAMDVCKAWRDKFGKKADESKLDEEDVLDFYRETELYLYDLSWYWGHNRHTRDNIMNHWVTSAKKVLDFGCGIGDYGLSFAIENKPDRVDFYDINKHCVKYLKNRIRLREVQNLVGKGVCRIFGEADFPFQKEEYDMIFALDFLEHVKHPEDYAAKFKRMLKRNGTLIAEIAPKGMFQPQHISGIDLSKHGFLQTDIFTYVRIDSDMAANYKATVQNIKKHMTVEPMKKERGIK